MAAPTAVPPVAVARRRPGRGRVGLTLESLRPVWSKPAAYRALRATLVIPALLAFTYEVVGNQQMATFAAFGGFATLVFASFGGGRRDRLIAHVGLGLVGTVLVVIGSAVSSSTAVAAVVTVPVVFVVLFAGIAGPNAASGGTAALLAYVLPAASPGTISMVPSRLAGWWLATVVGTVAVLLLSPRAGPDSLREAAGRGADAIADGLDAALSGAAGSDDVDQMMAAKHALTATFAGTPYRPTGLATSEQALANLVEALEWCAQLVADLVNEGADLTHAAAVDRDLLATESRMLRAVAGLTRGDEVDPGIDRLEGLQRGSEARVAALGRDAPCTDREVHVSFHARVLAAAARSAALDALIVAGRADAELVAGERLRWRGAAATEGPPPRAWSSLRAAARTVSGHASLRSVWFLNSARGAVALAAAIAVADLANVQHGFWVVLGTLSVLRTNAASTGSTALRALAGTAAGFFIGGALILAIGPDTSVLWAALPVAVLVAAYAPGTAPFAVGQAAFTVTVSLLYNILVPVGWRVGVLRVEDVAIGAAVSVVVGALFWPRGATAVVADDLGDAFHDGGRYLLQATAWAVGARPAQPDAGVRAARAGVRLDDALRGLTAEQGSKRVAKEHVWRLVGGTLRLRLTAQSLSVLPPPDLTLETAGRHLVEEADRLAGWCDGVARRLGRAATAPPGSLPGAVEEEAPSRLALSGYLLWVRHHLDHVSHHLDDLAEPIDAVAEHRARSWWH